MTEQYVVEYQNTRANLIFNPSFENQLWSGHLVGSTASILPFGYFPGYCLGVVSTSTSTANEYETPRIESRVIPGLPYAGQVRVGTGGNSRQMQVGIRFYDFNGSLLSQVIGSAVSVPSTGGFSRLLTVTATAAPATAHFASLFVRYQVTNPAVGNDAYIDALMLEQSAFVDTYFDFYSNPDDCYWTGVAYASPSALPTLDWVLLSDVQQISGSIGRRQFIDTFEPSRMTINARYPYGYSSPNYALRVGTQVRVSRVGSLYTMWTGRINNTTVEWGIPFSNTTSLGVTDLITIECEGAFADWGRLQGNDLFVAADDLLTQLSNVLSGTGLQYGTTYTAATSPELSSSEVSDSLANWLNTAAATIGATIKDGSDNNIVGINGRDFVGGLPVRFSDATTSATVQRYDSIVFDSVSADFFTEIEVNTVDFGNVVVQYRDPPYRTYRLTSFSPSIAQAEDLADYLLGIYGDNGFGISEISCKSEAQTTWALDLGYAWWDIIGYWTTVEFRGTTFRVVILGADFSATPDESRFTYYLADIGLTPFLVLNDTNAGRLDNNKLGW